MSAEETPQAEPRYEQDDLAVALAVVRQRKEYAYDAKQHELAAELRDSEKAIAAAQAVADGSLPFSTATTREILNEVIAARLAAEAEEKRVTEEFERLMGSAGIDTNIAQLFGE